MPLLGGLFGCAACFTSPAEWAAYFAWLPLLLDYSIPLFLYVAVRGFK